MSDENTRKRLGRGLAALIGDMGALFHKGERYEGEVKQARSAWSFEETLHPSKVDGGSVIIELHNVTRT